jgi:hypothetical protein
MLTDMHGHGKRKTKDHMVIVCWYWGKKQTEVLDVTKYFSDNFL